MWKKLQLKVSSVTVLNSPPSFSSYLKEISSTHVVQTELSKTSEFVLAFVTCQVELTPITSYISKNIPNDPVIWFAYPKKSSKKYKDISRDAGFEQLGKIGK